MKGGSDGLDVAVVECWHEAEGCEHVDDQDGRPTEDEDGDNDDEHLDHLRHLLSGGINVDSGLVGGERKLVVAIVHDVP